MTRPAIEPGDEDEVRQYLVQGDRREILAEYVVPDRMKSDGAAVAAKKRQTEMDLRAQARPYRVERIEQVSGRRARTVWPDDPDALEPSGYEPVCLEDRDDGDVEIRVLDHGPGVAPEEIGQIFGSFYRSESTARKAGGKGLGLTVCKRLVEVMGGQVWAKPREGGGLEVGFSLPMAQAPEAIAAQSET